MSSFRSPRAILLFMAMNVASQPGWAAPVPLTGELPLTTADIRALRARLDAGELLRTLDLLAQLRVFEDDGSTPERPVFYVAPFFSADQSQEVIGGQIIATDILDYLEALDALLDSVDGSHRYLDRLEAVRSNYLAVADQLTAAAGHLSPETSQSLVAFATLNNPFRQEVELVPARIRAAMSQLSSSLRRGVAAELVRALDSFGVELTSSERIRALTDPIGFVLLAVSKLRAKLATLVFGIRHATFVSGMTLEQTRLLSHYLQVRPDVDLRELPLRVLRVLPVSSTVDSGGLLGHATVSVPEMIRGVNASTGSVCGVMSACTVVVEYTEIGARSALLATRGAAILPALFVGDVAVPPDALSVPTTCDTGVLHERLVLPFGLGLFGDREVLRVLAGPEVCSTASGAASKPSSAVLLTDSYRNLFFDPAQVSALEARQLPADIARLLAGVEDGNAVLGLVGTILQEVEFDGTLDRFARTYYSRLVPRFPDELLAGVVVNSTSNPETVRFDFDGVAIACWKRAADGTSYLSACPDNAPEPPDIQWSTAARLEARRCPSIPVPSLCHLVIQGPPPDPSGYLWVDF